MKQINTALLSYGMSGKVFHAPFIHAHPGFRLLGSWERSKQLIQNDYDQVKSYPDYEALLADKEVELVVVNTPTYTHYEYTKKALLAGKHAIVEKAFTTTVAEAIELKELAEQRGLKLSVYQNRRWDSDFMTVARVISEGRLGELFEAEFHFDRYSENISAKMHRELPGPGAGNLKDLGAHLIDQALYLFGMPDAVFADIRIVRSQSAVDDSIDLLLYYNDKRIRLKSGMLVREPVPAFVAHGTKGSFLKSRADVQERDLIAGDMPAGANWGTEPESEQGWLHTEKDGKEISEKVKTLQGNYMAYYEGIYDAIVNNASMPVSAEDGINTMRIIEAAIKSTEERRVVEL